MTTTSRDDRVIVTSRAGVSRMSRGQISLRFHDELNDFLPDERRGVTFCQSFNGTGSIKDLIESIGVPHTEIDVIVVDGVTTGFEHRISAGEQVEVWPRHEAVPLQPLIRLRPPLPDPPRFVLDTHLGRLAAYLRLLGFDTLYSNHCDDPTLARLSAEQLRVLLTCDRGLLMRRQVRHGYFVRNRQPRAQLLEVVARLGLRERMAPFTRCMHCNGLLRAVDKAAVLGRLKPQTRAHYDEFSQCPGCGKVYWKGSHYRRLQLLIETTGAD